MTRKHLLQLMINIFVVVLISANQSVPTFAKESEIPTSIESTYQNENGLMFIENIGQFDKRALFQAQTGKATIYISQNEIWFSYLE
ncbi:MAG: hypothetical protein HYU84_08355, partial [Chloroflexi bacterium]|nr:hypothetical protein [Chloroflexota bacterium]